MSAPTSDLLGRRWVVQSAALIGSLGCTFGWLLRGAQWHGAGNVALIAAALALHGVLWWPASRRPADAAVSVSSADRLGSTGPLGSVRAATVLVGLVLVVAALLPLHHSRDLYLYDIYGTAVAEHHVSPYRTTPAELADPKVDHVAEGWHDQPSMYGPAFVGAASVVSMLAGDSELTIRLAWQLLTAAAALGAVVLVGRRTRAPAAVLALGCSPVLLAAVNDAHNDVLVGLGLLALVLLVDERRYVWAAGIAALVITTKVPAVFPVGAVGLWLWRRKGWRDAATFGLPALGAVVAAYVAVGGSAALVPLRESSGDDSRYALWQPWRDQRVEALLADGIPWREALDTVRDQMSTAALVLSVAVLLIVLWRYRHAARAGEVAAIAGVTLLAASTYVMPWYPAMFLPVAALAWRSRASVLLQVQGAFLLLAYAEGPGFDPTTTFGRMLEERAVWVNVVLLVVLVVWARPSVTSLTVAEKRSAAHTTSSLAPK
ncbi:MAG: glycosyltransferase 87 family protein [Actinomycetota bacterium]|nr:glycosyltransferase 87 family protein [Actinomycetota bacterium]